MALQKSRTRGAFIARSDGGPKIVAPSGASSPVAVDVPRDRCMVVADKFMIGDQSLLGKLTWLDKLRLAGGALVRAKPIPRQSGLLGDAPRDRPIVIPADGPAPHVVRSCYVMDR